MSDLSGVVDNYFTIASETFADNLSAGISAGATVVPVNNASEYTNGDCVVLTVEPGTVNEATFIGKKNGSQFEECIWTEGNVAVGHSSGATIIDYDSATHHNAQTKGIKQFAEDDGTLKTAAVRAALNLGTDDVSGWNILAYTPTVTTGYNKGNKEYEVTVASNNLTTLLSAGMRMRLQRGTTAPTQCADLEAGSSQYASRASGSLTGISFTDDFTLEAWVKPESFGGSGNIISRFDGTTGFALQHTSNGQVIIVGLGTAGASDNGQTYQSLETGIWQHVAATLDMSGATATIYINGISVPLGYTNGAASALIQAGPLQIGAANSVSFFDGEVTDARIWNVVRTATQIRDNMNQQLTGSETNLVGYFKLNGNFNDSTSNANNLTGSGGAVATTVDNPMHDTEYGIIHKVTYSAPNTIITLFTGSDYNIPNMTLSAPYYSSAYAPYGMAVDKNKFSVRAVHKVNSGSISIGSINTWVTSARSLAIPTGSWVAGFEGVLQLNSSVSGTRSGWYTLSNGAPTNSVVNQDLTARIYTTGATDAIETLARETRSPYVLAAAAVHTLYAAIDVATGTESLLVRGDQGAVVLYAESAYV